jgi:hypothetical protein
MTTALLDEFYSHLLDDYRAMLPLPQMMQKYRNAWNTSTFSWTDLEAQQIVHDKVTLQNA